MEKIKLGLIPNQEESLALALLRKSELVDVELFISRESYHVLRNFQEHLEVQAFLKRVNVMQPGRYFRRWARRLRSFGFTREDAKMLALGSFGTDVNKEILGSDTLVTYDQGLINNYLMQLTAVEAHLSAMTSNLREPYYQAVLPDVMQPLQAVYILG